MNNIFRAEDFTYISDRNEYVGEISELERKGRLGRVIYLLVGDNQPEEFRFQSDIFHNEELAGAWLASPKGATMTIFND